VVGCGRRVSDSACRVLVAGVESDMASFLVQNITHPIESTHRAGIRVDVASDNHVLARDAFLALHPAVPGDVIETVNYGNFSAFEAVEVLDFISISLPEPPPVGE